MKKLLFVLLFLTHFIFHSFSQVVNIYKISPQHLAVNTFSLTWERASSPTSRTSLNISPFISYYDKLSYRGSDAKEKLLGGGLEIGKKLYVSKLDSAAPLKGFYASGSISYGFFSTDYQKDNDSSYNRTGNYGPSITYISSGKYYHEDIHRLGADVFMGYHLPIKNVFYIDTFFGAGMRYAISSAGNDGYYKYGLIDIGHSGIIPKAGIKIGVRI